MDILAKYRWAKNKAEELASAIHWVESNLPRLYAISPQEQDIRAVETMSRVIDQTSSLKREIRNVLEDSGLSLEWNHPADLLDHLSRKIQEIESQQEVTQRDLQRLGDNLSKGRVQHKLRRVRDELNDLRGQAAKVLLAATPTSEPLPGPAGTKDWLNWFWQCEDPDSVLESVEPHYPDLACFLQAITPDQWQTVEPGVSPSSRPVSQPVGSPRAGLLAASKEHQTPGQTWPKASGDPGLDEAWCSLCATDWVGLTPHPTPNAQVNQVQSAEWNAAWIPPFDPQSSPHRETLHQPPEPTPVSWSTRPESSGKPVSSTPNPPAQGNLPQGSESWSSPAGQSSPPAQSGPSEPIPSVPKKRDSWFSLPKTPSAQPTPVPRSASGWDRRTPVPEPSASAGALPKVAPPVGPEKTPDQGKGPPLSGPVANSPSPGWQRATGQAIPSAWSQANPPVDTGSAKPSQAEAPRVVPPGVAAASSEPQRRDPATWGVPRKAQAGDTGPTVPPSSVNTPPQGGSQTSPTAGGSGWQAHTSSPAPSTPWDRPFGQGTGSAAAKEPNPVSPPPRVPPQGPFGAFPNSDVPAKPPASTEGANSGANRSAPGADLWGKPPAIPPGQPGGSPPGPRPDARPQAPGTTPIGTGGDAKSPPSDGFRSADPWAKPPVPQSVPNTPPVGGTTPVPGSGPAPQNDPWGRTPFGSAPREGQGASRPPIPEPKVGRKAPSWNRPKKLATVEPELETPQENLKAPAVPIPSTKASWNQPIEPRGGDQGATAPPAGPGQGTPQPMSEMEALLRGTTTPNPEPRPPEGPGPSSFEPSPPVSNQGGAPGGPSAGISWEKPAPEKPGQNLGPVGSAGLNAPPAPVGRPSRTDLRKSPVPAQVNAMGGWGPSPSRTNGTGGSHERGKSLYAEPPRSSQSLLRESGTRNTIHGAMLEIASKRRMIKNDPWLRSPLNSDQESILTDLSNGVVVIFGSRLSGIDKLMDGIREIPNFSGVVAAPMLVEVGQFEAWLTQVNQSLSQLGPGVALAVLDSSIRWSVPWVRFASSLLRSRTDNDRFLRVVFVADPSHDWTWTGEEERQQLGVFEMTLKQ